jgi:hypothetical protein
MQLLTAERRTKGLWAPMKAVAGYLLPYEEHEGISFQTLKIAGLKTETAFQKFPGKAG